MNNLQFRYKSDLLNFDDSWEEGEKGILAQQDMCWAWRKSCRIDRQWK